MGLVGQFSQRFDNPKPEEHLGEVTPMSGGLLEKAQQISGDSDEDVVAAADAVPVEIFPSANRTGNLSAAASRGTMSSTDARVSDHVKQKRDGMENLKPKNVKCKDCKAPFSGLHHNKKFNKTIEVSKCSKCFAKMLKCRKCKGVGHYP